MIRSVLKFFGLHKEAAPASTAPLAVPVAESNYLQAKPVAKAPRTAKVAKPKADVATSTKTAAKTSKKSAATTKPATKAKVAKPKAS